MQIEIESNPSYSMAIVTLEAGEEFTAESGSMVAMSSDVSVNTTFNGTGTGGALDWLQAAFFGFIRKILAGETWFVNKYKSRKAAQKVMVAPALIGDIVHETLEGDRDIIVQATSYMGSTSGISVDLIWGGFHMLFGGEGAFFMKCRGVGELLINAYGAVDKVLIDGSYVIDTGHVVAFEGGLKYRLRRAGGGWKSTLLSGEGLVMEFTGQGTVWVQTRNLGAFVPWLSPWIPKGSRAGGIASITEGVLG
jgi:uncharacterized protein (TIGR00266 family)